MKDNCELQAIMLLTFVDFCTVLNKICSFLAVLLPISSPTHRGRGCSASYEKWLVISNWKSSLMFIHRIEFALSFKDLSCQIMGADTIKLWWRKYVLNEAFFLSSHVLGGFVQCVWFRTTFFELLQKYLLQSLVN